MGQGFDGLPPFLDHYLCYCKFQEILVVPDPAVLSPATSVLTASPELVLMIDSKVAQSCFITLRLVSLETELEGELSTLVRSMLPGRGESSHRRTAEYCAAA